jgi:heme/copper-type cytochrome/quinol oxidase subunit 3
MAAVTTTDFRALPPAPEPHRRNVTLIGTVLAIAAGTMLVGGLLGSYFAMRDAIAEANGTWIERGALPNVALAVTYATLLMSSFTAQWAVSAIKMDERRQANVALAITLVLGVAFVNGLTFCWAQLGQTAGDGAYGTHMYAVTVTHLLLVLAAHVYLVVMGFRVLGGQFGPRNTEFVASAAAFWHFTVAAGAVIYWCLWFLEGGPG